MEEATQVVGKTVGVKKGKKFLVGVLALTVVFVLGYLSIGIWGKDWLRMWGAYEARKFDAAVQSELERLADMEKADTYGGATPEETARLILEALEKGDIDLASKYYYVLDQEEALGRYQKLQNDERMNVAVEFYQNLVTKGEKICDEKGSGCSLSYYSIQQVDEYQKLPGAIEPILLPKGSKIENSESFSLNQYSGLWKARN